MQRKRRPPAPPSYLALCTFHFPHDLEAMPSSTVPPIPGARTGRAVDKCAVPSACLFAIHGSQGRGEALPRQSKSFYLTSLPESGFCRVSSLRVNTGKRLQCIRLVLVTYYLGRN